MKHKKGKVISLILSATVVLSSVCAFNFSALADDASNNDTSSTTESTTNPTTESSAVDSSSTECSTTDISATTPSTEPTTIEKPISVGKLTNLKATKVTLKYVSVKWNKAENATNYKIEYRKAGKNYKFKALKTIKGTGATVPKLSANTLYYIKVTPFATKNSKIYYGSNAIIKVATATTSINGLKVTNNGKAISIKWNRNKNATGYKVYQSKSKNKGYKCVAKTTKRSYTTKKLPKNKTYYFKVQPYKSYKGKEINPTAKPKVKSQKVINISGSSGSGGSGYNSDQRINKYTGDYGTSYYDGNGNHWNDKGDHWTDEDLGGFLD